jgi:hypothetical protein
MPDVLSILFSAAEPLFFSAFSLKQLVCFISFGLTLHTNRDDTKEQLT